MGKKHIHDLVETQLKEHTEQQVEVARQATEVQMVELEKKMQAELDAARLQNDDSGERVDPGSCAWEPCSSRRRERSIYCSRSCSNKNARYRHSLRKQSRRERSVML